MSPYLEGAEWKTESTAASDSKLFAFGGRAMIDTLVKVAEKLTELLKYREQQRDKRFQLVLKPIYAELQRVHKDYLQIFERIERDLARNISLEQIIAWLSERRIEEETTRRAIFYQARALRNEIPELDSFFGSVSLYFQFTPLSGGSTITLSSQLAVWIEAAQARLAKGGASLIHEDAVDLRQPIRDELASNAHSALKQLRFQWTLISDEYGKALANSLK